MTDFDPLLPQITEASDRIVATANRLSDADLAAPSVCEGWSRAHVLAHVALNAEGLAGVLRGVVDANPTTIYASQEQRDLDIDELAAAGATQIRERLIAGNDAFAAALGRIRPEHAEIDIERIPGVRHFKVRRVGLVRLREVEIHHADLDADYSPADWPADTASLFLEDEIRSHGAAALVWKLTGRRAS